MCFVPGFGQELDKSINPDPREDPESRSPNLGPYTTKGYFIGTPIKGSTFWFFPGFWDSRTTLNSRALAAIFEGFLSQELQIS